MVDGIPQIDAFVIPDEHFAGNRTISMEEMFSSGMARKIYQDVSSKLWPFFFKHLIIEEDQNQVYPVLTKMIRKDTKSTGRSQLISVCDIMSKVCFNSHHITLYINYQNYNLDSFKSKCKNWVKANFIFTSINKMLS